MKVAIVSNSEVCVPILQHLIQCYAETIVFFGSTKAVRHQEEVTRFCMSAGVALSVECDGRSLEEWWQAKKPDVGFVIGFEKIIHVDQLPLRGNLFNIHFGSLPEFRGPNPVFWQLKTGANMLSVVIHRLTEKLDSGPVVWRNEFRNAEYMTYGLVFNVFSEALIEGVMFILSHFVQQQALQEVVQIESDASYYRRPGLRDVMISWKKMTARQVCDTVRACNPWNSGAITIYQGKEVKILDAQYLTERNSSSPGTILGIDNGIYVASSDQIIVKINILHLNGFTVASRFAAPFGFRSSQTFEDYNDSTNEKCS